MDMDVVALYKNGNSINKISKLVGISPYKIGKILNEHNVKIKRTNYQKLDLDVEEINRLYDLGKSTPEIAKVMGCHAETIRSRVKTRRSYSEVNRSRPDEIKKKISESCKAKWQDPAYIQNVQSGKGEKYIENLRLKSKKLWEDDRYCSKTLNAMHTTEARKKLRKHSKKIWQKESYYKKQQKHFAWRIKKASDAAVKILTTDIDKRKKWIEKLRKISTSRIIANPNISTSQKQLYYILKSSNIKFYEEGEDTCVGPFYITDCIIPKQQRMKKDLIVEVQGEYWHSLKRVMVRDRQKETYVRKHTEYDLLQLEELNLSSWEEISQTFSQYGLTLHKISCLIKELELREITEKDAFMLYTTFHYSNSIRKGALSFGVFFRDELIAAISYTYPIRKEVSSSLGMGHGEVMEISRMARKTNVICKNLMSWLIGNSRKKLPKHIKKLVTYSDTTYAHTGLVYKTAGFFKDKEIGPDYKYISMNGTYHKKRYGIEQRR